MTYITLHGDAGGILINKELGQHYRDKYSLDNLDVSDGIVTIKIVARIMTSSFIFGMFAPSIQKLGINDFYKKYIFVAATDIMDNIDINVRYIAEGVI